MPEGFNEQCITYQRSQSHPFPPPPLLHHRSPCSLLSVYLSCAMLLIFRPQSATADSVLYLSLCLLSSCRPFLLSGSLVPWKSLSSCIKATAVLSHRLEMHIHGDALSLSYPTLVHNSMCLKMCFLYRNHKTSPVQIGAAFSSMLFSLVINHADDSLLREMSSRYLCLQLCSSIWVMSSWWSGTTVDSARRKDNKINENVFIAMMVGLITMLYISVTVTWMRNWD